MSQAKQKTAKKTISTPKEKLDLLVEDQEAIEGIESEETLPTPTPKKNTRTIILIVALLLLVTLAAFAFSQNSTTQESLEESGAKEETQSFSELFRQPEVEKIVPTPSPSPTYIIPGKETYTASQGNKEAPKIKTISVDPQDPTTNDSLQTVTIIVSHSQPIDKVSLKLVSDNEEKMVDMVLVEGTDKSGTWETKWEVTDSILYKYTLSFTVYSQEEESEIDLTIR